MLACIINRSNNSNDKVGKKVRIDLKSIMKITPKKLGRIFKLQYVKLIRSPGGAKKVALGFAIGFGLEMLVLPTLSIIYLLFYPIARLTRTPLSVSVIGNVICKLTFLPVVFLPFAHNIGRFMVKINPHSHIPRSIIIYLQTLWGMTISGLILGILSYLVVYFLYTASLKLRLKKRENKRNNEK
jgi:uncharacterized protein (DUF2062 family)